MSRRPKNTGARGRNTRSSPARKSTKSNPYKGTDTYSDRAKKEGYAARSVYKLEEIQRRFKILRRGDKVVDLGCTPGSWSRYALEQVGAGGTVVGVDINPPAISGFTFLEQSVLEVTTEELLEHLGGRASVVLSDMAPLTRGDRFSDHVKQMELARRAADIAASILRPGGHFVVKVFDGEETIDFVQRLRLEYAKQKRIKPDATRKSSREFFLVCTGRKKPSD